jgi:hypothetical protein
MNCIEQDGLMLSQSFQPNVQLLAFLAQATSAGDLEGIRRCRRKLGPEVVSGRRRV